MYIYIYTRTYQYIPVLIEYVCKPFTWSQSYPRCMGPDTPGTGVGRHRLWCGEAQVRVWGGELGEGRGSGEGGMEGRARAGRVWPNRSRPEGPN